MKIGVISDTHGTTLSDLHPATLSALHQVDVIVHAGDFTEMGVLNGLQRLAKVIAVHGNMDSGYLRRILPRKEVFEINGRRIALTHGSGSRVGLSERVRDMFEDMHIIIHGHSHTPTAQTIDGTLVFNPGPAGRSYGLLTIESEVRAEIITIK